MVTLTNYFRPKFNSGSDSVLKRQIYDRLSKLYGYCLGYDLHSRVGTYDVWLCCSFVVMFLVVLVFLARLIFKEEQMPLDETKKRVESTNLALENLAKTLRGIKQPRYRSLTYEECLQIKKNKDSALRVVDLTKESEPEPEPPKTETQEPEVQEPIAPIVVAPKTLKLKTVRSTSIIKKPAPHRIGILRQITPPATERPRFDSSPSIKKSNLFCGSRASDAGNTQKAQQSVISVNKKPRVKFTKKP